MRFGGRERQGPSRRFARRRSDLEDTTRVLFVHTATAPPLGADTWVHVQTMTALDRASHEIHAACVVGTAEHPTPTYRALRAIPDVHLQPVRLGTERTGVTLRDSLCWLGGALQAASGLVGLARYVHRNDIALIHTSDRPRDALACVLLAHVTGAKCIIQVHVGYGDWMNPLLKWALRRADALIAVSAFVAQTLTDAGYGVGRTYVVHNAIEPARWQPGVGREDGRDEFGAAKDTFVVLTVCRLFPEKGPAELIEAMAALAPAHPDLRLLIVGQEMTPGFAAELRQLADDTGLGQRVVLAGRREDVPRLMAAADVYAMPSLEEPFGLVYLEAMAMELPVVALRSGGAPEIVDDGVTGLLSPYGDTDAIAANLGALAADPSRRAQMGALGRRHVLEHYTIERMARDVASVYREVAPPARSAQESVRPMTSLSTSDVAELERELEDRGYVVLPGVVAKESLELLGKEIGVAYEHADKFEGGGSITGHLNCFPGHRARFVYDELAEHGIVDAILAMRKDRPNNAVRATMNFNLPGSVAQHYHMDGLYTEDFLICNVAVIDTDLVNGAIDVLPGTNREFIPYWKFAVERTGRRSTRIQMRQGDVLVRKSTLWHRGMPNGSAAPRPMMSLTFGEASAPTGGLDATFAGDVVFYPNWFSTSRLGVLRERMFTAAPITYSAFRFAKSLTGKRGYKAY